MGGIREDEVAAAAMSVAVVRMKLGIRVGACTAGVGGNLAPEQVNFINRRRSACSVDSDHMVVIGAWARSGAIVGSLVVLVPVFREFDEYRYFAFRLYLVIIMISARRVMALPTPCPRAQDGRGGRPAS
jgi:ABC-type branched-subunit amino acid transport system permease subunit